MNSKMAGYPPSNSNNEAQLQTSQPAKATTSLTMIKLPLAPNSTEINCQHCGALVMTHTRHTSTTRTHVLALICCSLCCCCIPYFCDSARNTDHYCPSCHKYLGTYER